MPSARSKSSVTLPGYHPYQMRVVCKKQELGQQRRTADDDVRPPPLPPPCPPPLPATCHLRLARPPARHPACHPPPPRQDVLPLCYLVITPRCGSSTRRRGRWRSIAPAPAPPRSAWTPSSWSPNTTLTASWRRAARRGSRLTMALLTMALLTMVLLIAAVLTLAPLTLPPLTMALLTMAGAARQAGWRKPRCAGAGVHGPLPGEGHHHAHLTHTLYPTLTSHPNPHPNLPP